MLKLLSLALALQLGQAREIARIMDEGIRGGVFPGAVVVVGTQERVLLARGYGKLTWSSNGPAPSPDSTLYDLASLTKVVATTPAVMLLVDAGRIDLDGPVRDYLPEFRGPGKDEVTVRHLLEHSSGLRAFLPLNDMADTEAEARRLVLEEPLGWSPGGRVVYSDLNAMILGWIVERITGMGLNEFVRDSLYGPLGLKQTRFRLPREARRRAAPVGLWRGHAIAGEVHDQNAARLAGVSGHAGLFSTGSDLARYAQLWLRRGRLPSGERIFRPETVLLFSARGLGGRALGWEMRDTTTRENTGDLLSAAAYGHGGFTGTSIWIDPERDLFVIVLTNRVFSPRARNSITKLKEIRARVADAAVALRIEMCGIGGVGPPGGARC